MNVSQRGGGGMQCYSAHGCEQRLRSRRRQPAPHVACPVDADARFLSRAGRVPGRRKKRTRPAECGGSSNRAMRGGRGPNSPRVRLEFVAVDCAWPKGQVCPARPARREEPAVSSSVEGRRLATAAAKSTERRVGMTEGRVRTTSTAHATASSVSAATRRIISRRSLLQKASSFFFFVNR